MEPKNPPSPLLYEGSWHYQISIKGGDPENSEKTGGCFVNLSALYKGLRRHMFSKNFTEDSSKF